MRLTGAEIVVEQICLHGVKTVFGYPGGAVLPLYDALYQNQERLHHVLTAHEQGAVHAADGYARATGNTGVVIATSGPGATNLVTGIANAYLDSIPMVAITGNVPLAILGKDGFQEVDIAGITQPVVKHSFVVRDVEELAPILKEAFRLANSGRPGPVLVDIPKSVQVDTCEYHGVLSEVPEEMSSCPDLTAVIEALMASKRPYIYAGGGVLAGDAAHLLPILAEHLDAPVGLSMMGLTAMDSDHPLNLGMSGMHGKAASSMAQVACDVMLALGVRFSDRATGDAKAFVANKTIIHVDLDLAEIGKNVETHLDVCGDVKTVMTALLEKVPALKHEAWLAEVEAMKAKDQVRQQGTLTPQTVIETVQAHSTRDTVVATDVGQHQMWTMLYYGFHEPRTLLTSGGLGTMGYGMGAAIGGCLAREKAPTVLFTSEGSFGMNLNELATAVTQDLPLTIVLLHNNVLGMVRQWQRMFYEKRYSQTTLQRATDFVALAKAFGAEGMSVHTVEELYDALANRPVDKPVLLDCWIDQDEMVLPMIPPAGTISEMVVREA